MKKKFIVNLDAMLVIIALFAGSIALNVFLSCQFNESTQENQKLQWQGVEDSFNLSSQKTYIKKLEAQLKVEKNN